MDAIVQALAPLIVAWRVVVWICAGALLAVGALAFVRPSAIHRFIDGFVTANRVDVLELGVRLIVSTAFVGASPVTKLPRLFFWLGAAVAVTAIPMMLVHRLQRRHAARAAPFAKRIVPVMGASAIALGGLIAWAIA